MPRKKIAIIGTGIAGLGAAYILHPSHEITLYEKNDYIGGHSRTVDVHTEEGMVPVDTGFIVFNKRNYPLLTALFKHLDVPITESSMSFGISINKGSLEYGTQKLCNIFAQKRNLLRPSFWGMLFDILKFNKRARDYLLKEPSFTLGDCLDKLGMRQWFREYFLLAMGSAIWSMPSVDMLNFPASTFIRFFENHGLLTIDNHPQWYTVKGGSREYVRRLTKSFKERICLKCGATKVWRDESAQHVIVEDSHGQQKSYDEVVFACHADQALALVADKSADETAVLSAFKYQSNRAVLHSDISFMPQRRKAWSSWVYLADNSGKDDGDGDGCDRNSQVSLSYWMNNLQPLQTLRPLIVTLNPSREPEQRFIHNDYIFEHPIFDAHAISKQSAIADIQGKNRLWFCGAYQRYGFHEDALSSAVMMTKQMGIAPQW